MENKEEKPKLKSESKIENIDELIEKLMDELSVLKKIHVNEIKSVQQNKNYDMESSEYDTGIEIETPEGTMKMKSFTYYKMIYKDVNNLKKDTESLLSLYLDDVKPSIKSVDDSLKSLSEDLHKIEMELDNLKRHTRRPIKVWLEDKGKTAENAINVFKIIFWIMVSLYASFNAIPKLVVFILHAVNGI